MNGSKVRKDVYTVVMERNHYMRTGFSVGHNQPLTAEDHLELMCPRSVLTNRQRIHVSTYHRDVEFYLEKPGQKRPGRVSVVDKTDPPRDCLNREPLYKVFCPMKIARNLARWGTRGVSGELPVEYKLLKECTLEHLVAIRTTQRLDNAFDALIQQIIRIRVEEASLEALLTCKLPFIVEYAKVKANELK